MARFFCADGVIALETSRLALKTCSSAGEFAELLTPEAVGFQASGSFAQSGPFRTIAHHVFNDLHCKSILIQFPIQERDYTSEYSTFYSRTFKSYDRFCARIYFFSVSPEDHESPLEFIDRMVGESSCYLGFTTLRPIQRACVGRTAIRPKQGFFLTVRQRVRTKIAGQELELDAAPFIQQDSAVGMCVQASIWMALNAINEKHRKEPVTLADISREANDTWIEGRVLPGRDGLSSNQIKHALFNFGYHGLVINCAVISPSYKSARLDQALLLKEKNNPTAESSLEDARLEYVKFALYPYLESGIPVILVIETKNKEMHAVVLVGHAWKAHPSDSIVSATYITPKSGQTSNPPRIWLTSPTTYIPHLVVNNDNAGPYMTLPATGDGYSLAKAQVAFPILHQSVFMTAEEAVAAAEDQLGQFLWELVSVGKLAEMNIADRFLMRPVLRRRHDFRAWAMEELSGDNCTLYRTTFLPSHVWVMELYEQHTYYAVSPSLDNAERLGEVVVDATGDPNDCAVLLLRLAASVFGPNSETGVVYIQSANKLYPL